MIRKVVAPNSARITLSFGRDSDGPRSVGYINMLGMSFSLYQIWLYMTVFGASKTFQGDGAFLPFPPLSQTHHAILVYVFLASSALMLILFGLLHKSVATFFGSRKSVIVAGIFGVGGTAMLLFGAGASTIAVAIAALLMGICASLFIILLGNAFARFEFATCVLDSAASVALGYIGAIAFVNWLPPLASGIIAVLMPALMTAAFWKKTYYAPGSADSGIGTSYVRTYLMQFVVSMLLFGVVVGALRVICADKLLSFGGITIELVLMAACIVGVLMLLFSLAVSKRETFWDSVIRYAMPLIALGIACIAALQSDFVLLAAFFTSLGFVSLAALLWIFIASMARNLNGSAITIFGIGYGLMHASSMIGCFLCNTLLGLDSASLDAASFLESPTAEAGVDSLLTSYDVAILVIVLCVVLSFAYAVMPRYREMRGMFSSALSDMIRNRKAEEDAAKTIDSEKGDKEFDALPADDGSKRTTSASNDSQSLQKPLHGYIEIPMQEEVNEVEDAAPRDDKGSFVRRCDQLSDEFGLSAREREVFFLLAKGHNAAYIMEKLCVSRSTAKTHINHIYKKMDIHTQQELLTMVEDRTRGPLGADVDRDAIREALENDPSKVVEQIHRDYIGF